jgi:hypothetical protein
MVMYRLYLFFCIHWVFCGARDYTQIAHMLSTCSTTIHTVYMPHITQTSLKLALLLPQPSKYWDYRYMPSGRHLLIFWQYGVWTQGLMLAMPVLHHLNHIPTLFCLTYFLNRVSHLFARAGLDWDPPIHTSYPPGMTGVCHHAQVLLVEMHLTYFLPRMASNIDPPDLHLPSI